MSLPNPIVLLDARAKYAHPAFQVTRASAKTVFDATGKLVTVPVNAIGWDHDPATGQALGHLAEQQATNLLLHSNDLTQGAWSKGGVSITPGAITGPDGNGMAKIVEDANLTTHGVYQDITITDSNPIALSIIAKAAEREFAYLRIADRDNPVTSRVLLKWHLVNGTLEIIGESGTATLVHSGSRYLGNGFWFLWMSATIGGGITNCRCNAYIGDTSSAAQYQGDGTSGIYAGHFQASESSYPTSYIETGAATATRASDNSPIPHTAIANGYWGKRHTFVFDINVLPYDFDIEANIFSHVPGFALRRMVDGTIQLRGSGIVGNRVVVSSQDAEGRHVIAVSWDDDGVIAASDGAITAPAGFSEPPSTTPSLVIGGGYYQAFRAVYYPQRISNADLQSLTAIQE